MEGLQGRRKKPRSKASPAAYPDDGPVELDRAYVELSSEAFAAWLRLHLEGRDVLRSGRGKIATILRYSERRSNELLRELSLKGYIDLIPGGHPGTATEVLIRRRALVNARANFVRLA